MDERIGREKPKNWMLESILMTILCCLPFGIVGIIHASRVDSRYNLGDIDGSYESSQEAKKWLRYGLLIGVIIYSIYFIAMLITIIDA